MIKNSISVRFNTHRNDIILLTPYWLVVWSKPFSVASFHRFSSQTVVKANSTRSSSSVAHTDPQAGIQQHADHGCWYHSVSCPTAVSTIVLSPSLGGAVFKWRWLCDVITDHMIKGGHQLLEPLLGMYVHSSHFQRNEGPPMINYVILGTTFPIPPV